MTDDLKGLGSFVQKYIPYLKRCGIESCHDVLYYFPFRFDDFSHIIPIAELRAGMTCTIRGTITLLATRRLRSRRTGVTEAMVADESGAVKIVWFNQQFIAKTFKVGDVISVSGTTSDNILDLHFTNPIVEGYRQGATGVHTGRLTPIYHITKGLTQKTFRRIIRICLDAYLEAVQEWLPAVILEEERFPPLKEALEAIHFPLSQEGYMRARKRFEFEEIFLLQLFASKIRQGTLTQRAEVLVPPRGMVEDYISSFPFSFTDDQEKVVEEILHDFMQGHPMNRLVEGDVGSGKTAVASVALYAAFLCGKQSAYMAPTAILASQHALSLSTSLCARGMKVGLLTSKKSMVFEGESEAQEITKKNLCARIADGTIDLVIGTHALLEESVEFKDLALAVIDEQHRFGVGQRKRLKQENEQGLMPHLLSMTATPIPRTLALALYGDLDISLIRSMPEGRKPVITKIVPDGYRQWTYDFVTAQISEGHQAFIICPLVDPSEKMAMKAVTQEYERLASEVFPHLVMDFVHGKMKPAEKDTAMQAMASGEVHILVATSVIEVGVNVPNATVLLIEGAERFGLAQLHQLRGRVGRSSAQSYCFLLPTDTSKKERQRLTIMTECSDGFELAEKDMELRGTGDLYGTRQSGLPELRVADITDVALIQKTQKWVKYILPRMAQEKGLQEALERFEGAVHLE